MRHLYAAGARLAGSLAIALLTLSLLAAPDQLAFADPGDCPGYCQEQCSGNSDPQTCMQNCMNDCLAQGGPYVDCTAPKCRNKIDDTCTVICTEALCDKTNKTRRCGNANPAGCVCKPGQ